MNPSKAKREYRRPARKVQIFDGDKVVNERYASSLRQALLEFAKERSNEKPIIVGNVVNVNGREYVAKDAPAAPTPPDGKFPGAVANPVTPPFVDGTILNQDAA